MLITVKDFKWRQTEHSVIINVPLQGIHPSKVDIFTSDKYLKAHYQPFLFEVFLLHEVDNSRSVCTLTPQEIIFELVKPDPSEWSTLHDPTISKKDGVALKQQIIDETQQRLQREAKEKSEKRHELKRVAVRNQISYDTNRLNDIKNFKEIERRKAMVELETWKHKSEKSKTRNYITNIEQAKQVKSKINTPPGQSGDDVHKIKPKPKPIPEPISIPRQNTSIEVTFTAREFPTPSRESQTAEEQEWLKKQAEARRAAGFVIEDLRPEEHDPQWLKNRGDHFYTQRNYLGAISAYSYGIKMSPKFAALYVNRSAAHFAAGNLHKTIEDCSTALELLTPPVPANLESRAKCLARRGAALCRMDLHKKGVPEFEAALKLLPNNVELRQDLENAVANVNTTNKLDASTDLFIGHL